MPLGRRRTSVGETGIRHRFEPARILTRKGLRLPDGMKCVKLQGNKIEEDRGAAIPSNPLSGLILLAVDTIRLGLRDKRRSKTERNGFAVVLEPFAPSAYIC